MESYLLKYMAGGPQCLKRKPFSEPERMPGRARLPPRRLVNSFGKRWSISDKASMELVPRSKRSQSDFRRLDGPERSCRRPKKERLRRELGARRHAIIPKGRKPPVARRRQPGRER